jgi:hypothetical protein
MIVIEGKQVKCCNCSIIQPLGEYFNRKKQEWEDLHTNICRIDDIINNIPAPHNRGLEKINE